MHLTNVHTTRSLSLLVTLLCIGRLYAITCDDDADFTAKDLVPNAAYPGQNGWFAQASYWNTGTNGWTMARYANAGVSHNFYGVNHGLYRNQSNCHNYQDLFFGDRLWVNVTFAIQEWYWNGAVSDGHGTFGSHEGKSWIQVTPQSTLKTTMEMLDEQQDHACAKIWDQDGDQP